MLCAMVNNNVRCYNESMEFAERVEDTLDDNHKVCVWWGGGASQCTCLSSTGLSTHSNSCVWILTGVHMPCIEPSSVFKTCSNIFLV